MANQGCDSFRKTGPSIGLARTDPYTCNRVFSGHHRSTSESSVTAGVNKCHTSKMLNISTSRQM